MKFARYWIPPILGFVVGSILSLKMSGTPMRDLLTSAKAEANSTSIATEGKSIGATAPLAESERFIRFFSAVQEFRGLKRRSDLHSAIGDLGSQDMEPLLARLESLRWKVNTNELNEAILQHWLEIDRAAAASWIRKHPELRSYQVLWAKSDPEAALKELRQNPQTSWPEEIMRAAVDTLTSDADEKARLILQLPDSAARNQVLINLTNELAASDSSKALKFAQNIPESAWRSATVTNVLMEWARKDSEGAAKEISTRLSEIENTRRFGELMTQTIASIATKDFDRAVEWIGSLPEHQRTNATYSAAATAWARKEPTAALQWCVANGIDLGSGPLVGNAMYTKPKETLHWIQSQPPGEMRDALLERALMTRLPNRGDLTSKHGDAAFQALQLLPQESQIRVAAAIAKTNSGGDADPAQFSNWLEKLQDPALRAATIAGTAEVKALYNQKVAIDFSMKFAEGLDRNAALRGLANNFKNHDDERLAADTALRITDQTLQLKTLDTFMVDWLRKDPKAATQWLKTAPSIPPNQSASWQREANSAF